MTDKTIPVYWDAATESIKPVAVSGENTLTDAGIRAIVRDYADKGDRYFGSLVKSSTNADSVGVMHDTFYEQPIGTHPGSALSTGSIAYHLYQIQDSEGSIAPSSPVFMVADSDGNLWEMNDSEQSSLGARLNERVHTNELGGSFRMATSAPSSDWDLWESSVFEDTIVGQGTVVYNIYRKNDGGSYNSATANPLKLHATKDLKETSNSEVEELAKNLILNAAQETGVGDYQIRTSVEGAPTESGTWVSRGIAVDTRNVTQNLQYTSENFVGTAYSRQYTQQYTGEYTNISYADVPQQFAGSRERTFAGSRTYSRGGMGFEDGFAGDRTYSTTSYVGARQFAGSRTYAQTQFSSYVGTRSFTGERDKFYAGTRQFAGTRVKPITRITYGGFAGTRQFAGSRQSSFSGLRFYPAFFPGFYNPGGNVNPIVPGNVNPSTGGNTNPGGNVNPIVEGNPFPGNRNPGGNPFPIAPGVNPPQGKDQGYENPIPGNPFPIAPGINPGGNVNPGGVNPPTGGNTNPGGNVNPVEPGNVNPSTGGNVNPGGNLNPGFFSPIGYSKAFTGPRTSNFTGGRSFTGPRYFTGSRAFGQQYTSATAQFLSPIPTVTPFSGTRTFTGKRTFSGQYVRQFADFAGDRTYAGSYAGSRTFAGDYTGTYTNQYAGFRPESYTGNYTGQYSSQYTAFYTTQYSQQYTGETLVSLQAEVETYTLYCRISES